LTHALPIGFLMEYHPHIGREIKNLIEKIIISSYKQFVLPHILPWYEAQKECNFERANLATFQNEADYAFIVGRVEEKNFKN